MDSSSFASTLFFGDEVRLRTCIRIWQFIERFLGKIHQRHGLVRRELQVYDLPRGYCWGYPVRLVWAKVE